MQSYEAFNLFDIELNIFTVKYAVLDKSWKNDNVCSSFTRIYMPVKGEGFIRVGKQEIRLLPGNIYIIPASLRFSYKCEDCLEKLFIHMSLKKQDGYDALSNIGKCLILREKGELVERIFGLLNEASIQSLIEFKAALFQVLMEGLSQNGVNLGKAASYPGLVMRAISYIDRHLSASLSIRQVCSSLYTSRSTLHKLFREHLNMSLGRYIDDRILAECERYLVNTDMSIKEISDKLQFCDQFYFSRKFSKRYGFSPSAYRKMNNI